MSDDLKKFLSIEYIPRRTIEYIINILIKELFNLKSEYQIGNFENQELSIEIRILEGKIDLLEDIIEENKK